MAKTRTKGVELFYVSGASAATKVGCVTSIDGLGGAADNIDETCFDSAEREYSAGYPNPGQVNIGFIWDTEDAGHEDLLALKESGAKIQWFIGFSDGTADPTVASSAFVAMVTRTNIVFTAFVADVTFAFQQNDVVRNQLVLQRSGAIAYTAKT